MIAGQPWPSVSAVVATRDRPQLVRRAISAILDQDYPGPIECLVVFDQSAEQKQSLPVGPNRTLRTISNTRTPGLPGARNSGILGSSGELVAFCDDDDEWLPGKLTAQVELLRTTAEASAVSCGIQVRYKGRDRPRLPGPQPLRHADFLRDRQMAVHPSTVLTRRADLLNRIGLVDEEIPGGYGEDYDWLLRAAQIGPVYAVPEPLVVVHWHATSFFFDRWRMIAAALAYLQEKHPQFADDPRGFARLQGQMAFAYAGMGDPVQARAHAGRALRSNWREKRALLALLVSTGLVPATTVTRVAHRFGRGI